MAITPDRNLTFLSVKNEKSISLIWFLSLFIAFFVHIILLIFMFIFYAENTSVVDEERMIAVEISLDLSAPVVEQDAENIIMPESVQHVSNVEQNLKLNSDSELQKNPEKEQNESEDLNAEEVDENQPKLENIKPLQKDEKKENKSIKDKKTAAPHNRVDNKGNNKKAAPNLNLNKNNTFTSPKTTQTDGNNGKMIAQWQSKVQRLITLTCRKLKGSGGSQGRTAYVSFSVNQQGGIASLSLFRSSGDQAVDRLALEAVRKSSPFPQPPAGWTKSLIIPVTIK